MNYSNEVNVPPVDVDRNRSLPVAKPFLNDRPSKVDLGDLELDDGFDPPTREPSTRHSRALTRTSFLVDIESNASIALAE